MMVYVASKRQREEGSREREEGKRKREKEQRERNRGGEGEWQGFRLRRRGVVVAIVWLGKTGPCQ